MSKEEKIKLWCKGRLFELMNGIGDNDAKTVLKDLLDFIDDDPTIEELTKDAFKYERKHDTAMVLASECLRNHGWFNREHDFNDLWKFICGVKELFSGEFKDSDEVILIRYKKK